MSPLHCREVAPLGKATVKWEEVKSCLPLKRMRSAPVGVARRGESPGERGGSGAETGRPWNRPRFRKPSLPGRGPSACIHGAPGKLQRHPGSNASLKHGNVQSD